jgi:hypothetical protein
VFVCMLNIYYNNKAYEKIQIATIWGSVLIRNCKEEKRDIW